MKINENGIFLRPCIALGARINKLQRRVMRIQKELDDIEERRREKLKKLSNGNSISLKCEKEK